MKWENLSKLMNSIQFEIDEYEFFLGNLDTQDTLDNFNILARQRGVVRTNCIDCLDRTNVA